MSFLIYALLALTAAPGVQDRGIDVRGHWTMTVRNEDGTVAARHEFDNAFVGPFSMRQLLLQRWSNNGGWKVTLEIRDASNANVGCLNGANPPATTFCFMYTPGTVGASPSVGLPGLQVIADGDKLLLKGTFRAAGDGVVTSAETDVFVCYTPDCANGARPPFTTRDLRFPHAPGELVPAPIAVKARQHIELTVEITLS